MLRENAVLNVVIPVFNEEESLPETFSRLQSVRNSFLDDQIDVDFIFVDDGSKDSSLKILRKLSSLHTHVKILSFSRNFGHQIAITAGIDHAAGDYVAVIDADLQDPPELLRDMYHAVLQGYDVVYGKRKSRSGETWFKKASAVAFYRLLSYLCEIEIPADTGDFRLMSRRAVEALKLLRERHRFMRGMVPWVGFPSLAIEYHRSERFAGETKYPFKKMVAFAVNAILSFSKKPISIATRIGLLTILAGVIGAIYMVYLKLFTEIPVPGVTAILVTIVVFSGVQILLIGLIGEYIARIFEEVKARPLYILAEKCNL